MKFAKPMRLYHNDGQPIVVAGRVGRNDDCPCGSGKKYKKCRLQSDACQTCPTHGKMAIYKRKTGELFFVCETCRSEQVIQEKLREEADRKMLIEKAGKP